MTLYSMTRASPFHHDSGWNSHCKGINRGVFRCVLFRQSPSASGVLSLVFSHVASRPGAAPRSAWWPGDDAGPAISSPGMGAAHVFFGSGADSLYVRLVIGLSAIFGGRLVQQMARDNGFKVGRDDLDGGYA